MRRIDADALLKRWCAEVCKPNPNCNEDCTMYDYLTIESLSPTIDPEPQWILCSERLPEKPEQVLIYAWNVHYVLAKYREIRTLEGIYKMAWVMEDAYNAPHEIKHDVIAWMPLPEPYKGGELE